jgi:hypothetical protein
VTPERRSRGGEGRSPVHPFDPAVILLVSNKSEDRPQLFGYPFPTAVFMTNPSCDDLREHEGGPELWTTRWSSGRRI